MIYCLKFKSLYFCECHFFEGAFLGVLFVLLLLFEAVMGRKNKLSLVFDFIRQGNSLFKSCQKAGIATRDFYLSLAKAPELKDDFQLALADYADQCTDDIRALADLLKNGGIDNSTAKLLIETQKWLALKACPETFAGIKEEGEEDDKKSQEILVKFI